MSAVVAGIGMTSQRTRTRMIDRLREKGIADEVVLAAIAAVPRHLFVEEALASRAYEDTALPLGHGQTISQPFVVARMLEVLRAGRELGRTLEIGAGSGYQAAVLAQLTGEVYAVERIAPLLAKARINLQSAGQHQVHLEYGDGRLGLPHAAPYDTIIVAAATARVPNALLQQLALGGKMLLPLGTAGEQCLLLIERRADGCVETRLDGVRFVPLLPGVE